jgi:hypothetical protein
VTCIRSIKRVRNVLPRWPGSLRHRYACLMSSAFGRCLMDGSSKPRSALGKYFMWELVDRVSFSVFLNCLDIPLSIFVSPACYKGGYVEVAKCFLEATTDWMTYLYSRQYNFLSYAWWWGFLFSDTRLSANHRQKSGWGSLKWPSGSTVVLSLIFRWIRLYNFHPHHRAVKLDQ